MTMWQVYAYILPVRALPSINKYLTDWAIH